MESEMEEDTQTNTVTVETPVPPVVQAPPTERRERPVRKARTVSKVRITKSNKGRKWSFERVGIGSGTKLRSTMIPAVIVTVVSDNTVRMKGKEMSLTAAAKIIARRKHKKWPSIQGPMYFAPVSGPKKGQRLAQMVH